MSKARRRIFICIVFFLGCNSYSPKEEISGGAGRTAVARPDYASVDTLIFRPYCMVCHSHATGNSGGVNLESYETIVAAMDKVMVQAVFRQRMPPGRPLPVHLRQTLVNWFSQGTPLKGSPEYPAPTPTPEVSVDPTFFSIRQNILGPKCMGCHGPTGRAAKVPVDDLNFLLNTKLIIPGDPMGSIFYLVLVNKKMPPENPLSSVELDAIKLWITNGAPAN